MLCRLPEIQGELQKLLQQTEHDIELLPKPPSNDPCGDVFDLIDLLRHLEGTPEEDGLLQAIRPNQLRFRKAIRATAPEFRPYEQKNAANGSILFNEFIVDEEEVDEIDVTDLGERDIIFIDEVFDRAQKYVLHNIEHSSITSYISVRARTRELSDVYPFIVQEAYISSIIGQWKNPALDLFEAVCKILGDHVRELIHKHFGHFGNGALQHIVQYVSLTSKLLWSSDYGSAGWSSLNTSRSVETGLKRG